MTLDALIALTLLYGAWKGWRRGIVMSLLYLLGAIVGLVVSVKFSGVIGDWAVRNGFAFGAKGSTVGFLASFIGLGLLMRLAGRAIHGVLRATGLSGINRAIGAAVQISIFALLWSCLLWIGTRASLIPVKLRKESLLLPLIEPLAPYIFSKMGVLISLFKWLISEIAHLVGQMKVAK